MMQTVNPCQAANESSDRSGEESTTEAAARAVDRLLANPRRTRRD